MPLLLAIHREGVFSILGAGHYAHFVKTRTIESIDYLAERIMPRYAESDAKSERELSNLLRNPILDRHTAVILDSGGSHSVAMAAKLAASNRQPIIMFDAAPLSNGFTGQAVQGSATMLYFAQQMEALKEQSISPDSPPVFVLDCHRSDRPIDQDTIERSDNSYQYTTLDFPTADDFKRHGINRVIYLNEGDQKGYIEPTYQSADRLSSDLKKTISGWADGGIEILYTGILPVRSKANKE